MMAITHAAIAAAGTSLVLGTSDLTPLVGSQLPDLDSTETVIGQVCFPVACWFEDHYPHRSVTHSLIATGVLSVLSMVVGGVAE
jgi:inner membrane protein